MRIAIIATGLIAGILATTPALAEEGGGPSRVRQYIWQQLDTDGDGVISRAEIDARNAALFREADVDGDGVLNFDELIEYRQLRRRLFQEARFRALDTDGNGVISAAELAAVSDRHWSRLDADEDGVISPEEFNRRHRHQHQPRRD